MGAPADLARKLGVRPGIRICLLEATPATAGLLRVACADVEVDDTLAQAHYDLVFLWPRTLGGLTARLMELQRVIAPDGTIWVVIPKQAASRKHGIAFTWDEMQAAVLATDLVDNKIASLSADEYATRFVIRKERRATYR